MKRILLILTLIFMFVLPVFGQSGTYTTYGYFYKPPYGGFGMDEFNEYNTYMQVADTQIEANKTASGDENIQDVVGAMSTSNTETFISVDYQDSDGTTDYVVPVKDEDNMASDSATHLATQQSIKAYADTLHALQYLKTEMDSFSEIQAIISNKTLVNEEDVFTIDANWVNTANPWADNEVADTLTVTGYMQDGDINTFSELQSWVSDKTLVNEEDIFTIDANWVNTANPWADNEVADNITIDLATLATTFTCTDNESEALACPIVFVDGATGAQGAETDGDFTYTPSTGTVTATAYAGDGSALTNIGVGVAIALTYNVKEENTSSIVKGQPVYQSGATGQAYPKVGLADADVAVKSHVLGLADDAISQNGIGTVISAGALEGIDTLGTNAVNPSGQTWTAGDLLYLHTTAGGLTNVEPTVGRVVEVGHSLYGSSNTDAIVLHLHMTHPHIEVATGEDIILRLGDSGASNKVYIKDYSNTEVAYIDSDGKADFTSLTLDTALVDAEVNDDITITIADTTDSTSFPLLAETITGAQKVKSDAGLTYDASTGDLKATKHGGITEANLVDLSATENITGTWTFVNNIGVNKVSDTATAKASIILRKKRVTGDDVASGDHLGCVLSYGYHTDGYDLGTEICSIVDGTPGNTDMPSRLEFKTSADASATPTLAMTIDSSQVVTFANDLADSEISDTLTASTCTGNSATFTATDNENEALACPIVFVDGATGAQGAETDDTDFTYNPSTGTLTTTLLVSEIRLVTSDADPDTTAEIKHDSTITGIMAGGALRWFDDDSSRMLVDLETDPTDDDYVVAYDSTADGFYMKADADSGGATAWDDITNPDANDEIDFAAYVIELNVENFQIGDGGANYVDFDGTPTVTFAGNADIDLPNDSVDNTDINFNFATSSTEAGEATTFNVTDNESEALACPIIFVDGATGSQGAESDDTDFTYNPSTGTMKLTALDLTTVLPDAEVANNITIDLATLATTFTATDNESEDLDCAIVFLDGYTGAQGAETDGDFHYSPDTGLLTSTSFAGNPLQDVTTSSSVNTLTVAEAGLILVSDAHTETLPTASGNTGLTYHFIKTDYDYDLITLEGDGAETFNYENSTGSPNLTYLRLNTPCAEVTVVSDGTNWQVIDEAMGQVPECRVYLSADQADLADDTWTLIEYDTEEYDIGSNFNTTTHLFVAPVAGKYEVVCMLNWKAVAVVADKSYGLLYYKDATVMQAQWQQASLVTNVTNMLLDTVSLAVGEEITVKANPRSGVGTCDVEGNIYYPLIIRLLAKD